MKNIFIILITLLIVDAAHAQILRSNVSREKTDTSVNEHKTYISGNTEVTGIIVSKSESDCYETINDLFIARGENIQVESGQSKTFVACKSIVFGPGFTAVAGSYMHAYISTNYCPDLPGSITPILKGDIDKTTHSNDFQSIHEDYDIGIYPNPTKGKICVDFLNHPFMDAEIFIMDSKGQRIQKLNTQNREKIDIDLTYLSSGTYFVVIRDADMVTTKKIVKK